MGRYTHTHDNADWLLCKMPNNPIDNGSSSKAIIIIKQTGDCLQDIS